MTGPTYQLSVLVAAVLSVVQFTMGYSYKYCIKDPKSYYHNTTPATPTIPPSFNCIRRQTHNISAIVADLPPSATMLTICLNTLKHVPDNAFDHLPRLRNLKMDHNDLMTISKKAFHNLDQLESLNMSCNNISSLSPLVFGNLHNLTFLSLSNNILKRLPPDIFSNVSNLEILILRKNFLYNFSEVAESVTRLQKLTKLDLCFNNLTHLNHSTGTRLPTSLTILYLCRNNLLTLSCENKFLGHIQLLDLSYNDHLPSTAFQNVDLRNIRYLRVRSTNVTVPMLLNFSNINANHIDFSGMGLHNTILLKEFCKLLRSKVRFIRKMNLESNRINETLEEDTLTDCPAITGSLDLSRTQMRNVNCFSFLKRQNQLQIFSVEHNHLTSLQSCTWQNNIYLPNLTEISFRYNRILKISKFAFHQMPNIKSLQLNINTIAYLDRKALKRLFNLVTLRLDNNLLTDLFQDSFEDLHSLQTLNLRNNRISVIFSNTFHSLQELTTLDLGGNKISHFQESALVGLKNLAKFYLDGNNFKKIDSSGFGEFQSTLQVLDLQRNQISFLSDRSSSPFVNLTKLRDLKLDGQMPYGISLLPRAFFSGLSSLKALYLTNNHITRFATDAFDDLTGLRFLSLDNSCEGVLQLQPGVFKNLRNLSKLIAENMGIQNFSKDVFGNLTSLQILQLNHNVMQTIDVDVLEALPKLRYLDIRSIPLSCTCSNSKLQNWTLSNQRVQLVYLYDLKCPDTKYQFYNFDKKVCYRVIDEYLFITTSFMVIFTTIMPLLYVKLYWKLKYSYYVFRSWFGEHWRRLREEQEEYKYDAFISYNSADESWVLTQLLPNLEGNGSSFRLCLHHRDFEPGRYIVDNIVSAVYSSRKTICVVSRHFLHSEWCSLEIQLASYRLFHELRDVLLLVFLEPIPERQLSAYHRMRKVMLKKTYLQWPGSECSDPTQAQEMFWNQLKRALQSGNNRFEGAEERDEEQETEKSDDEKMLLP